jgi:hypothetical protein
MDNKLYEEAYKFLLGKELGFGLSRKVFECNLCSEYVVKVEYTSQRYFQNVLEMLTWREVETTKLAKYFAECIAISDGGQLLIQEKTRPVLKRELPKKLPEFFGDIKQDNWGVVSRSGRELVVCHDYGYINILAKGLGFNSIHGKKPQVFKEVTW